MAGHVMLPDETGRIRLLVEPVRIGSGAMVGAYSVLTPGVAVGEGEVSPPLRLLRTAHLRRGRR